jgi:DNA-binding transcriptional ArsR family regulator
VFRLNNEEIIEEILGFRSRIRILDTLSKYGEMYITQLSRETRLGYDITEENLQILKEMGLVKEKRIDNMRFLKPNFENLKFVITHGKGIEYQSR